MKFFKYFILFILRIIIVAGVSAFVLKNYYGKEIKQKIITELNKQLTTEIEVGEVLFSSNTLLRDFPNLSVDFVDVIAKSSKNFNKNEFDINTDTLLVAEKLSLHFNIKDIWEHKYNITNIWVENGNLSLFIDKKGYGNYNFWSESQDSTSEGINIQIDDLRLQNMQIRMVDNYSEQNVDLTANNLRLKGNFSSEKYELDAQAKLYIRNYSIAGHRYIDHHEINTSLNFAVDQDVFSINDGFLQAAGLSFNVEGQINNSKQTNIDLNINGENLNINSFLSLLPDDIEHYTEDYKSTGEFYFNSHIFGKVGGKFYPSVETEFGIKKGKISTRGSDKELHNVNAKGNFSNGKNQCLKTSSLQLDNFSFELDSNSFDGQLSIKDFDYPLVNLSASTTFNLSDLNNFIHSDSIETLNGKIDGNFQFKGRIKNLGKISGKEIQKAATKGTVNIKDVNLKLSNYDYNFHDVSGNVSFENNDLKLNKLLISIDDHSFETEGSLDNFLSYILIDNQNIKIRGNIYSPAIDLNKIIDDNSDTGTEEKTKLPNNIQCNVSIKTDAFKYDKLNGTDISANLIYASNKGVIKNLSMNTMKGKVLFDVNFEQQKDLTYNISCSGDIHTIDIQSLFHSFNNFGQDFLQEDNLHGKITSNIDFKAQFTNSFQPIYKSIHTVADVKIENGELNNFKPMYELSRFIDIEELQNINFETIENEILIKNEVIYIPQMEINSSAFNISINGKHTFNNEYTYRLSILLSEILSKREKLSNQDNEFGIIEDDGMGRTKIYIKLSGIGEDVKIEYDKESVKNKLKNDLKNEKDNLKSILKEEFGVFRKDTTIKKIESPEDKPNNVQFIFDELEEDTEPVSKPKEDKIKNKETNKPKNNSDPPVKVVFDDDF